jgi:hypothetical protein
MNELLRQFIAPTRKLALATVSLFAQGLLQLVLVIFFVFFIFRDADTYADALRTGAASWPAISASACSNWRRHGHRRHGRHRRHGGRAGARWR